MKRKLIIVLTTLITLTLTGCEEPEIEIPVTPEVLPEEDKEEIIPPVVPDIETPDEGFDNEAEYVEEVVNRIILHNEVKQDFSLLTSYEDPNYLYDDITLEWSSNNEAIVVNDSIAKVTVGLEDVLVTLSLEASMDEVVVEKDFEVVVKKYDIIPPKYYTPLEVMNIIETNLVNEKEYLKNVSGQSITLDDLGVTQVINNNTYVYNDYTYAIFESSSWAVSFTHKAMFYNDKIKYSHSSDKVNEVSIENYKSKYGLLADSANFTGYVISEETVLSSQLVSSEKNKHVFEYVLDNDKSSYDMRVQMKEFGGLTALPVFSSIKLTLTLDDQWNISKLETHELYKTKKRIIFIIETPLEQKLTMTFSKYENIELPDISNYI